MKRYGYRAAPGARPGSINTPEGALPPELHVTCYDGENIEEYDNLSLSKIAELRGQSQVMWIDAVGLGDARLIEEIGHNWDFTVWHLRIW